MTMKLKEIALFKELASGDAGEVEITGVTSDSRKVERGFLFAALKGVKADGAAFVVDAVKRGSPGGLVGPVKGNLGAPRHRTHGHPLLPQPLSDTPAGFAIGANHQITIITMCIHLPSPKI